MRARALAQEGCAGLPGLARRPALPPHRQGDRAARLRASRRWRPTGRASGRFSGHAQEPARALLPRLPDRPRRAVETVDDYNLLPAVAARSRRSSRSRHRRRQSGRSSSRRRPTYRAHRTFVTPAAGRAGLVRGRRLGAPRLRGAARTAAGPSTSSSPTWSCCRARTTTAASRSRSSRDATGAPVAGAEVRLYRFDWQQGHRGVARGRPATTAWSRFATPAARAARRYFLLARRGDDVALDAD